MSEWEAGYFSLTLDPSGGVEMVYKDVTYPARLGAALSTAGFNDKELTRRFFSLLQVTKRAPPKEK